MYDTTVLKAVILPAHRRLWYGKLEKPENDGAVAGLGLGGLGGPERLSLNT